MQKRMDRVSINDHECGKFCLPNARWSCVAVRRLEPKDPVNRSRPATIALALVLSLTSSAPSQPPRSGTPPPPKADLRAEWITNLKSQDAATRRAAMAAIVEFGRIPPSRAPVSPLLAHSAVVFEALAARLNDEDKTVRAAAVKLLAERFWVRPPEPRSPSPPLNLSEAQAGTCLPAILDALKSSDAKVRVAAADILTLVKSDQKDVLQPLAALLKDTEVSVRLAGVRALGLVTPKVAAVGALRDALRDDKPVVRTAAVEQLGQIGAPAVEAVPQLVAALNDPDRGCANRAAQALGSIKEKKLSVPALVAALKSDNDAVWGSAASALGYIGEEALSVPALADALANPRITSSAVNALGRYGDRAKSAAPALIAVVRGGGVNSDHALTALFRVDPSNEQSVAVLRTALADPTRPDLRSAAVGICHDHRPDAKTFAPLLLDVFKDAKNPLRQGTLRALFAVDPDGEPANTCLIAALKDPPYKGAAEAAFRICKSRGAKAKAAFPTLLDLFRSSKGHRRADVLTALFVIDPDNKDAQAALVTALKAFPDPNKPGFPSEDEWDDAYAAWRFTVRFCQTQGPAAKSAVPTLVELHAALKSPEMRRAIVTALQRIDPEAAKKLGGG